jgi:hypothetical protein
MIAMKHTLKYWIGFMVLLLLTATGYPQQQASLTIINKSNRHMTTKVIKGTEKKSVLHHTVSIPPKGKEIIYFSETGRYFTKTQAVLFETDTLIKNDTLYSKSHPFEVISDRRGFSNITMKFKVKESKKPILQGSFPITRKEYEQD